MNKTIIIIIGALFVGALLATAFLFGNSRVTVKQSISPVEQTTEVPAEQSVTQSGNAVIKIATTTPSTVIQKSNFLTDSSTTQDPINTGYYYLGYDVKEGIPGTGSKDNPPYLITYISSTNYFNIALLQEPIGTVRIEAEQYLMKKLGITQDEMCKLSYMVSVPYRVNSQFSGTSLGFSFCQGSTILPG